MKKNYQSPVTQTVNVETENLLGEAASIHNNAPEGTGIDGATLNHGATLNNKEERIKNHYYDLSGRRLEGRPTKPGVYMSSGRKVVMR